MNFSYFIQARVQGFSIDGNQDMANRHQLMREVDEDRLQ